MRINLTLIFFAATLLMGSLSPAQEKKISGTVTDENGVPLPGVNVTVKGTTKGTSTDFDGGYEIEVGQGQTLKFSFVGYSDKEIMIGQDQTIDVIMETGNALDEVVVIGYGTSKKRDITGSISSISSEDFNKGAQTSINSLIQGRAAGVHIKQADAEPGGLFSIRIRGANSITGGNEPLYVIDGLPGAPLNALNPGDIESIEILKDASATAIYGSRGANGVVLISTKKGKNGSMKITYDGYFGMQRAANTINLLGLNDYTDFVNGIREERGQEPAFTQEEIDAAEAGTNWQDEVLRSAVVQNHQLTLSGGSNNTNYYVSLSHFDQDGVVINTGLKRTTARINIDHSGEKFDFGINLSTSVVDDTNIPRSVYGINGDAGVLATANQLDPLQPVYNPDGSYAQSDRLDLDNPVAQAKEIINKDQTNRTFGNVYAQYELLHNFKAKLNLGSDRKISRADNYISKKTKRGQNTNGAANINQSENNSNLIEFTLHYQNTFNDRHELEILGGTTYEEFINRGFNAGAQDFPTEAFGFNNLGAGDEERNIVGSFKNKHQLLSYLGRVNYTFNNKYLLTASFRVDGSSRFGEDEKYGYFPSLALSWRLSEENFIENLNTFSDLKLRTSYGVTGNQSIGNYNSLILLGTTGKATFNGKQNVGIAPIQLANPNLKWETTDQYNIGLDFGFWKNRITGSMDYFYKETSDLLLQLPIPSTTGFVTSLQNVGDTQNKGFEFSVKSKNFTGDFNWTTSLNISTLKNKVTNLGKLPRILQGNIRFVDDFTILKEGYPINSYFGYHTDGVFQSQDDIEGSPQPNAKPGDLKYVDENGDGKLTPDDRVILGNPFPDLNIGFNNTFVYKGFDLSIFFDASFGNDLLNFTRIDSENPISFLRNRMDYVMNRWSPDNPTNSNPSFYSNDLTHAVNDRVVEDASFIRLQNLTLGYNFPKLSAKGINQLRIYGTVQNLFTITDYSGYNPEVSSLGNSNLKVDYNAYPVSRTFTLGVKIGL